MRRVMIALVGFVSLSVTAHGEDMQKYLRDTQALVGEGKHEEALERFQWFHDHALEHEPSMYGVRLSFALSCWKDLGDVYPPALTALKKTRDDKTDRLLRKEGDVDLFHDAAALNRTLGQDAKTVELFRRLDKDQPDLAKQCWGMAEEVVIKAKAYDLARKYIGNPLREWGKVKAMYDQNKTMYESKRLGEHLKAYNENSFVEKTIRLMEVAIALDDMKAAKEIQAKALAVVDDYRLNDAMPADEDKNARQEE